MRRTISLVRRWLPRGQTLPDENWRHRHNAILVLLAVHSLAIPAFALVRGYSLLHAVLEGLIVPAAALVAAWDRWPRRLRTAAASLGLLSSSAVLVHLSGGVIEMHFHFFVMVAVVALYQDWIPFLAAIGYVLVHHGAIGALDPSSVYNHPAAIRSPWKWAAIHALFIAGISIACLVTWRLNETILAQRRRAEERLREETHVVETLNEIGRALAAELDLKTVVQLVTDAVTQLTEAEFGAFFYNVVDASGESYMLYALSGVPDGAFARFPMPRNTAIFNPTFAGEEVIRLDDVTKDPRYGLSAPHFGMPEGHLPVRSYLAVPVKSRTGAVLGGLFFGHADPGRFTDVDERIAVGIASHAAVAIDNARLYEAQLEAVQASEAASRRLALLADAGRALSTSLEHETILEELAACVVPAVADSCAVFLADDEGNLQPVVHERAGGGRDLPDTASLLDAARRAVLAGEPTSVAVTRDAEALSGPDRQVVGTAVPLVGRHGAFGAVVTVHRTSSGRGITTEDVHLVEELARRASVAVENARLYALQRTAAETLQHSLLPDRLPEIPGVSMAARYQPGAAGAEIGGDWYDVLPLSSGALGLVMGDVVGRGVEAASLMGHLRNALRAYLMEGHGPVAVLQQLNRLIGEAPSSTRMATLLLAVYEIDTGRLRFATAGHLPPIIVSDGGIRLVEEGRGVPLGVVSRPVFREVETTLQPGSTLLLYTDGLVEDRTLSLDEGLNRVLSCLQDAPTEVEELCDHIMRCGLYEREARDDVALLALRTLELGSHIHLRVPSSPRVLHPLRSTLRRWLDSMGVNQDEAYEILVACGEACTNAIRHSGSTDSFELEGEVDGRVRLVVRDTGRWRRRSETSRRPGGRGLNVMREFMDDVRIETDAMGTEVTMLRSFAGGVQAER